MGAHPMIRGPSGRAGRARGWRGLLLLIPLLGGCLAGGPSPLSTLSAASPRGEPIVFLVRHAERSDNDPRDPDLSPAGRERAALLASLLAEAELTAIYATPWKRTQQTAAPLAEALGLPVRIYDASDSTAMAGLTQDILAGRERILVVGHSNTVPSTVTRLGGEGGGPMAEDEYDRLYVVTPGAPGAMNTVLLRFGARWTPGVPREARVRSLSPPLPGR